MDAKETEPPKPALRRRRPKKKPAVTPHSTTQSKVGKPRKAKKKRKVTGTPSMMSLAGGPIRIPEGLKDRPKTAERLANLESKRREIAKPKPLQLNVERLISGLPDQSMGNLRQQWINLQKMIAKGGKHKGLRRFETALLAEWGRRHVLAVRNPDHFDWPTTDAENGDGSMPFEKWHGEGMLAFLGYHVGSTQGVTDPIRRQILDATFAHMLPPVNNLAYLREWSEPATAPRLRRLANEIARFARNARRKRSANMERAVADWEDDLQYLYRKYYVGKFGFGWPSTLS